MRNEAKRELKSREKTRAVIQLASNFVLKNTILANFKYKFEERKNKYEE